MIYPLKRVASVAFIFCGFFCAGIYAQTSTTNFVDAQHIGGELQIGVGILSDDSYRYGRYTGVVDKGIAPLLYLQINSQPRWNSTDSRFAWFEINYVGVDSVLANGAIGKSGDQKASIDFRKISNFLYDDTLTVFSGLTNQTLPNNWQASGNTTAGMSVLDSSLRTNTVEQQRNRWQFTYEKKFLFDNTHSFWDFSIDVRHEDKEGERLQSGTIGTNGGNSRAALLIAPLNFETDIVVARMNYNAKRSHVGIGYEISLFKNSDQSLQWQNPFGQHPQWETGVGFPNGTGQLALEPDNEMHRLFVSGGFRFAKTGNAQFDLSRSTMTQDQGFLPYTNNANLNAPIALPRNNLDGEVEALHFNSRVSLLPLPKFNISANFRFDDRENNTPRDLYQYIAGDAENQVASVDGFVNRPYSNTKKDFSLDGKYRLSRGMRFHIAYQRLDIDRDYAQIENSVEQSISTGIRLTRFSNLSLSAKLTVADRDAGNYQGNLPIIRAHLPGTIAASEFEDHPLLRKYHLNDRRRNSAQLRTDWFLSSSLNLGFSATYNQDEYDGAFFGLNQSTQKNYTFDLGYSMTEHGQLSAFLSQENYNNEQSSRSFTFVPGQFLDPNRNWFTDSDDDFMSAGLNLDWTHLQQDWTLLPDIGLTKQFDAGIEILYSRSRGEVDTKTGPALASSPLPDLYTRLKSAKVYANYKIAEGTTLRFSVQHESYRSDDFALDGIDPATMANVLSFGNQSPNYSVNWFSFAYGIKF